MSELKKRGENLVKAQERFKRDTERYKTAVRENCGVSRIGIDLKQSAEALKRAQNAYNSLK